MDYACKDFKSKYVIKNKPPPNPTHSPIWIRTLGGNAGLPPRGHGPCKETVRGGAWRPLREMRAGLCFPRTQITPEGIIASNEHPLCLNNPY